jgi:hypothetical protein
MWILFVHKFFPGQSVHLAAALAADPAHNAVLLGQAAFREGQSLIRKGFRADVIYAHAGFGPGLYMGDAFPHVPLLGYFEGYYRSESADADFLAPRGVTEDERLRIRNAALLIELTECACGVCPTAFQRHQFPPGSSGSL